MRTIADVLSGVVSPPGITRLDAPRYSPPENGRDVRIGLAVESMSRHTSNEGFELFTGLERGNYGLVGGNLGGRYNPHNKGDKCDAISGSTDLHQILDYYNPTTIVVQDHREWQGGTAGKGFDERERFTNVGILRNRHDIFKGTVLKDSHQRPKYHRDAADEMGCHFWITYYHPDIVCRYAPYVRREHLIRTYHSVDSRCVPHYSANRTYGCLLSGAVSGAYPLRSRLFRESRLLPHTTALPHPGYHRRGSCTPQFLQILSKYKVSICTSSVYGYATRKIIESTAAGCVVVTDLPSDDVLTHIDGNLVRVDSTISTKDIADIIATEIKLYSPDRQSHYAEQAKQWYDYRVQGRKLSEDIEQLRRGYNDVQ